MYVASVPNSEPRDELGLEIQWILEALMRFGHGIKLQLRTRLRKPVKAVPGPSSEPVADRLTSLEERVRVLKVLKLHELRWHALNSRRDCVRGAEASRGSDCDQRRSVRSSDPREPHGCGTGHGHCGDGASGRSRNCRGSNRCRHRANSSSIEGRSGGCGPSG